jgi:hypothetical protein
VWVMWAWAGQAVPRSALGVAGPRWALSRKLLCAAKRVMARAPAPAGRVERAQPVVSAPGPPGCRRHQRGWALELGGPPLAWPRVELAGCVVAGATAQPGWARGGRCGPARHGTAQPDSLSGVSGQSVRPVEQAQLAGCAPGLGGLGHSSD